jgi:hypothetical protein
MEEIKCEHIVYDKDDLNWCIVCNQDLTLLFDKKHSNLPCKGYKDNNKEENGVRYEGCRNCNFIISAKIIKSTNSF